MRSCGYESFGAEMIDRLGKICVKIEGNKRNYDKGKMEPIFCPWLDPRTMASIQSLS